MADPDREDAPLARARSKARRAAHAFIIVIAVAFIALSTIQIVEAVFAEGGTAVAQAGACSRGVARLAKALERGCALSATDEPNANPMRPLTASEPFLINPSAPRPGQGVPLDDAPGAAGGAGAEADAVERACTATPGGLDAWAALERLRLAQEELARRDRTDLEPLARAVSAHLPIDLR